jgi:hypothetical protein
MAAAVVAAAARQFASHKPLQYARKTRELNKKLADLTKTEQERPRHCRLQLAAV